jgi:hypothetical protein
MFERCMNGITGKRILNLVWMFSKKKNPCIITIKFEFHTKLNVIHLFHGVSLFFTIIPGHIDMFVLFWHRLKGSVGA